MTTTFTETITLEKFTCKKCSGIFSLNSSFVDHARSNHGGYWCPYCSAHWAWTESDADRLRKQLEEKERQLTASKCETMRANQLLLNSQVEKRAVEKKLRRVEKGVCPCCKRSFTNLRRHMETKHPAAKI